MVSIELATDKRGNPLAYRYSVKAMRKIRISVEHAQLLISTGGGRVTKDPAWCFVCDRPKNDCGCVENGGNY